MKTLFDYIERARANPNVDGKNGARLALGRIEVGILQSHLSRGKSQLGVSRHALRFPISRHVMERIEVLDLAGDSIPEAG
jgi:hypothetical protein